MDGLAQPPAPDGLTGTQQHPVAAPFAVPHDQLAARAGFEMLEELFGGSHYQACDMGAEVPAPRGRSEVGDAVGAAVVERMLDDPEWLGAGSMCQLSRDAEREHTVIVDGAEVLRVQRPDAVGGEEPPVQE